MHALRYPFVSMPYNHNPCTVSGYSQFHMNNFTDSTITGLLLIIDRLQQTDRLLGRKTIVPLAELKLPRVAQAYDALISKLLDQKLIPGNAEHFVLCPDGLDRVHDLSQRDSLHASFYNEYYRAMLQSRAHSLFCERVYGKDLGQHGMADLEQIEAML